MKILYITPGYSPLVGGAETHVQSLAEGMARRGHKVTVVTDQGCAPAFEILNDVHIHRTFRYRTWMDGPDRVPWEESYFGLLRECQIILGEECFDVIHAHCQVSVLLAALLSRQLTRRWIVSMHETSPQIDAFGDSRSRLLYQNLPYDALIAGSKYFEEQALQYGAPKEKVRLIYYGTDIERFSPKRSGDMIRTALNITPEQKLVLLVGRFKARKGILEFIRAMERVHTSMPTIRGLIVGSCNSASYDYRNAMFTEIKTAHLEHAITVAEEQFDYTEMPHVFAAADLVVQPSYGEGFGIAVIEALASRKPVIATATSGVKEIITHGKNGWLIERPDVGLLANAILHILTDYTLADELAATGCSMVQSIYHIDNMVTETECVYQNTIMHSQQASLPS